MRTSIERVLAWEALDSRGTPTVACEVQLAGGARGTATVPSGASRGRYEARELRDGGVRYRGQGSRAAVANVRDVLGPGVRGLDAVQQEEIDARLRQLDGTPNLRRLGANAVLAVSVAAALAAADAADIPLFAHVARQGQPMILPLPLVNIISGGAHANRLIDIQDILAIPLGATSFSESLEWIWEVRQVCAELASGQGHSTGLVADEGGLGLPMKSNREAVALLTQAIGHAGFTPGKHVGIAVDFAANQLVASKGYELATEGRLLSTPGLVRELEYWCQAFPLVSLEDPLSDGDWLGWKQMTEVIGSGCQLIGDDLFATNVDRLRRGVEEGVANAILIKPNQVGTLSDAYSTLRYAQRQAYACIISARSGDSEDSWLADLAVGWGVGQIKVGSLTRSERTAKWNRLLRIEEELGSAARFAGGSILGRNPSPGNEQEEDTGIQL